MSEHKAPLERLEEKVDAIAVKLDQLAESHYFFKGKVIGASAVVAVIVAGLFELIR